ASYFLGPICAPGNLAWRRRLVVVGLALIVLLLEALVLFAYFEAAANRGEPFGWLEGISAWPSELIRNFALVLTYIFFLAACGRLDKSNAEMRSWFVEPADPPKLTLWHCLVGKLPEPGTAVNDVPSFVNAYVLLSSPRWCFCRALFWTAVF